MECQVKQSTTSLAQTNTKEIPKIKIVVVGASSVGKTSLSTRFAYDYYDPRSPTTLGASYLEKLFEHPQGNEYKFQIWDTTGQEKYKSIAKIYYKEAKIALLVFDVTDDDSLNNLREWTQEVVNHSSEDILLAVVGNKIDLLENSNQAARHDIEQKGKNYAQSIGAKYYRTSAKDNIGLKEMFSALCQAYINKPDTNRTPTIILPLNNSVIHEKKQRCCRS